MPEDPLGSLLTRPVIKRRRHRVASFAERTTTLQSYSLRRDPHARPGLLQAVVHLSSPFHFVNNSPMLRAEVI